MIRPCVESDFSQIWTIINDGARAYQGIIPADRWTEPYMSREKLQHEIAAGVVFWGFEENGELVGVMGTQSVQDVTLIRHAYVLTSHQKKGIGAQLLAHLRSMAATPVLIGTWAAATWAIRFYQSHGFRLVTTGEKNYLLKKYWTIPARQVETSVVLSQMTTATGTFSVKMLPLSPTTAQNDGFAHISLDKTFDGPLAGTSRVEMMATSDGSHPSGGYVALERFTGQLDGKSGTFVMQHSGIMAPGLIDIKVLISPGTGTGDLTGIQGTLEIRIQGKQHFYTLHYELPG